MLPRLKATQLTLLQKTTSNMSQMTAVNLNFFPHYEKMKIKITCIVPRIIFLHYVSMFQSDSDLHQHQFA